MRNRSEIIARELGYMLDGLMLVALRGLGIAALIKYIFTI